MWNKVNKQWLIVLGIAISLPSTIGLLAYVLMTLSEMGYFSKAIGMGILLLVIFNSFLMMVLYANKRKNKP